MRGSNVIFFLSICHYFFFTFVSDVLFASPCIFCCTLLSEKFFSFSPLFFVLSSYSFLNFVLFMFTLKQRNGDGFDEVEVTVYDYFVNHRKIALCYSDVLPTYFPIEVALFNI